MQIRGVSVDYVTLGRWFFKFPPLVMKNMRSRKRRVLGSWHLDETYVKVNGMWIYLYRALDESGLNIAAIKGYNKARLLNSKFIDKKFE